MPVQKFDKSEGWWNDRVGKKEMFRYTNSDAFLHTSLVFAFIIRYQIIVTLWTVILMKLQGPSLHREHFKKYFGKAHQAKQMMHLWSNRKKWIQADLVLLLLLCYSMRRSKFWIQDMLKKRKRHVNITIIFLCCCKINLLSAFAIVPSFQ